MQYAMIILKKYCILLSQFMSIVTFNLLTNMIKLSFDHIIKSNEKNEESQICNASKFSCIMSTIINISKKKIALK